MSILVDSNTRLLVQGITGTAAQHHTENMLAYGTNIVAGVRPGAAGQTVHGVPVYDTVKTAVEQQQANAAILFIPAHVMKDAAFESLDAGIKLLVMVSEHVPLHDSLAIVAKAQQCQAQVIGPNTPGLIAPAESCKIGFVPADYYMPGHIGVASRSGTLTYEIVSRLTKAGIGQSTCVGVGGDGINGSSFANIARLFEADPDTSSILIVGEVGGSMEEEIAEMVTQGELTKPVVSYIAGRTAPEGKRMGHAGAIVAGGRGSIASKLEAFAKASIPVAKTPAEVVDLISTL